MHLTLTIEADSPEELAPFFTGRSALGNFVERQQAANAKPYDPPPAEPETVKEVEPEAETPKRTRGKKADAAKQDTPDTKSSPASSDGATATTDASPSSVSLDDIRTKASQLMDSGKASGKDIQELLVAKFDARAFGALDASQYADVLGELNNLG